MKRKDTIDYQGMVQSAVRKVMHDILADVAANGLPGDHHFYIDFLTNYPGVELPEYLREEYPDDITIVLQHDFWELAVDGKGFSVGLDFDDVPEKIAIPYDAILRFVDPSVNFGFEFAPTFEGVDGVDDFDLSVILDEDDDEKKPVKSPTNGETNVVTLDSFRKNKEK